MPPARAHRACRPRFLIALKCLRTTDERVGYVFFDSQALYFTKSKLLPSARCTFISHDQVREKHRQSHSFLLSQGAGGFQRCSNVRRKRAFYDVEKQSELEQGLTQRPFS